MKFASRAHRAIRLTRRLPLQIARSRQLFPPMSSSASLGYVGYSHFGNVGDDLIYASHERSLGSVPLIPLPTELERLVLGTAKTLGGTRNINGILLGGGTVVGRTDWRRRVTNAAARLNVPIIATGVGVEDPEFAGRRTHKDFSELQQWASLVFRDSPHVSVRGPRSQEILQRVGVDATVVSDTALLLAPDELTIARGARRTIGVTFAVAGDERDSVYLQSIQQCVKALSELTRDDWAVSMFVFDKRDLPLTSQMAAEIGGNVRIIPTPTDVTELLDDIEACDVFVGQRLHSVVMAAACGVPAIALEYQPKCRDFQMSIGRGDWTLSTSEVSAPKLLSLVSELYANRSSHSAQIRTAVLPAKQQLLADQQKIAALLHLGTVERAHIHQ